MEIKTEDPLDIGPILDDDHDKSDPLALDISTNTSSIFFNEEPGTINEFQPKNKKIRLNQDIRNPDIQEEDRVTVKTEVIDDNFSYTDEFAFVDPNVEIKNEDVENIEMLQTTGNLNPIKERKTSIKTLPDNAMIRLNKNEKIGKISSNGFQCMFCDFVTDNRNVNVINHMIKVHMKKGSYSHTCHFCGISTKTVAGIHWHLGEFHKFNFMKKADKYLWSYTVIENGGKCSTCSSTFETLQSYKNHSPCHSAENSSLYTSYQFIKNGGKCSSCLETFEDLKVYKHHIDFSCPQSSQEKDFDKHPERFTEDISSFFLHHNTEIKTEAFSNVQQNQKKTISSSFTKDQKRSPLSQQENSFKNKEYIQSFKMSLSLSQNEKKHKCYKCSAAYKNACSLKDHLKICGLPKNFKCNLCDHAYVEKRRLDAHFKTIHDSHHPCKYCTLAFKTSEALEFHLYSIHQCKNCGTVFSNVMDLKSHDVCNINATDFSDVMKKEKMIKVEIEENLEYTNTEKEMAIKTEDPLDIDH